MSIVNNDLFADGHFFAVLYRQEAPTVDFPMIALFPSYHWLTELLSIRVLCVHRARASLQEGLRRSFLSFSAESDLTSSPQDSFGHCSPPRRPLLPALQPYWDTIAFGHQTRQAEACRQLRNHTTQNIPDRIVCCTASTAQHLAQHIPIKNSPRSYHSLHNSYWPETSARPEARIYICSEAGVGIPCPRSNSAKLLVHIQRLKIR